MNEPEISSSIPAPASSGIPESPAELKKLPSWATIDARKEDKGWDDLEKVKLQNDKMWLTVYGKILLGITIVFAVAFMAALLAWVWHYLSPKGWHWLEDYQLSKIQSVLFSGGMGAIISNIIRTQIEKSY